jgi:predicted ribosomally synthesized peptide with SipW-like signal peptide
MPDLGPSKLPTTQTPKSPEDDGAATRLDSPLPPATDRYEFLSEIATGGMGVVYAARDKSLSRDVAVKVLHGRFPAGTVAARRFVEEAKITGQLQHPGIPAVHDLGALPDSRPFLAMKLIRGDTLDDLIKNRPDPGHDRGRFVTIFEDVCQALGYAHSHHVIHRDLKPANIMVGAFGEVQVMDWGLAKVLTGREQERSETVVADPELTAALTEIESDRDDSSATRAGSVLGTPAYMPPEQAIGAVEQIDERSDVFGLGAILCTILTGKPPFVASDSESTRQLAARGKLEDAFARLDSCGAGPDLITLCKCCLSPERAERPANAGEVAQAVADLRAGAEQRARQAELDRVRVEGERAKAEAEAREQRKRRRVQMALAAAVVLLLLGGGVFAWWQDRHATARLEQVKRNAEAVKSLLAECEAALRADEAQKAGLALGAAEQRAAEGGAEGLADQLARCRADLELLNELDRIDDLWWTTVQGVSQKDQAAAAWPVAFAKFGITPGSTPPADAARLLRESVIRDDALAALDFWFIRDRSPNLLAILREADPEPFRDAVRSAVHDSKEDRVRELAAGPDALTQPVRFALVLGRLSEVPADRRIQILKLALRSLPSSLGVLMELGGCFDGDRAETAVERIRWYQVATSVRPENATAHFLLGVALHHKGDHDGALVEFDEASRLDPKLASPHVGIGTVRFVRGDRDGAIAAWREAIRLDPGSAVPHSNIGGVLADKGDADGAIFECRDAVRLDPKLAWAHNNLASALLMKGEIEKAVEEARESIRLDPKSGTSHANLGLALAAQGKRDQAIAEFREAIRLESTVTNAFAGLGDALRADGNRDGAISAYREAIRLDPKRIAVHNSLIATLVENGEPTAAVAAAREVVRIAPQEANAHTHLGYALQSQGKPEAAIPELEESLRLNPNDGWTEMHLGMCLRETNDLERSLPHLRAAIRLAPNDAHTHSELGYTLQTKKYFDDAIAAYREAVRIDPKAAYALYNLGVSLEEIGNFDEAVAAFDAGAKADTKDVSVRNDLAWLLATGPDGVRNGKRAVEHATKACELTEWKEPNNLETLAAAYAEDGDFDKAIENQKKALSFPDYAERSKEARQRLELYSQKKPYRDAALIPPPREKGPPPREVKSN